MTRKKFVKMLMWAGMQRNDAAACAQLVQEAGRDYFHVLGALLCHHNQHFKRPAFGVMWLQIRGTILRGANNAPWFILPDIDEMHLHKDDSTLLAMQTGLAKVADAAISFGRSWRDALCSTVDLSAAMGGGGHE